MPSVSDCKTEYGDDWPLGQDQISILNANQEILVDLMDPNDLIGQLFSAEVLNYRQQKSISSEPNVFVKTQTLLEIIRRRSLRDYKKTIEGLHATNQSHVAQILEEGGGMTLSVSICCLLHLRIYCQDN